MKEFFYKAWRAAVRAGTFFVLFSALLVLVLRWLPVSYTPLMFIRCAQNIGEGKAKIMHKWVSFDHIPNSLQLAVVCTEDQNFLYHHGFDFDQIQKAREEAEEGGRVRGASTISQQTAKNVFLWPTSNYLRKGLEAWFTVLIELFWSKERIMEVYLNSVEFGPGIYGCEAASQHFFHKPARNLTLDQSAQLAVVLPDPLVYNAGKPSPYLVDRKKWAFGQMDNHGFVLKYDDEPPPPPTRKKSRSKIKPQSESTK